MASDKELADFLAGVERRAFKQTVYAVRDDDASLDIVQDAMIKLADKIWRPSSSRTSAAVSAYSAECDARLFSSAESAQYLG